MQKRSKSPGASRESAHIPRAGNSGVVGMVEHLLDFLSHHQTDRGEGVQALLVAFVQAASRVLEDSGGDELDANRNAILQMLEQARRVIDERPAAPAAGYTIH
jgi:hypothetical protein